MPKNFQITCFLSSSQMPNYPVISKIKTIYVADTIFINISISFDMKILFFNPRIRFGFAIQLVNEK